MEKPMTRNVQKTLGIRVALAAAVAFPLIIAMSARAQEPAPPPPTGTNVAPAAGAPAATEATAERVIVTGSNIPTAEEVGPNPVDTYRRDDITRLGVRTPTDLILRIPAATGSNTTENNTNRGFANDRGEETGYLLAGTGDDKTNIVVYAGIYNASAIYSRDSEISHDADKNLFGGFDGRSGNYPGRVTARQFRGSAGGTQHLDLRSPTPHSAANQFTSTEYTNRFQPLGSLPNHQGFREGVPSERSLFNFADLTPSIAATDREYLYGSFDRDICDKYLTVFADFEYFRQFWDGGLAPTPFVPDIWTDVGGSNSQNGVFQTFGAHPFGISSSGFTVPTQNAFNPFTQADYTSNGGFSTSFPSFSQQSAAPAGTEFTTGVRYRSLEAGLRTLKITTNNYLFTGGLKGNLGEFANAWDQLKTWEWEAGIRYNEDYRTTNTGGVVNNYALRNRLLDTDPATAFNPFGISQNSRQVKNEVFVTTHQITDSVLLTEDFTLRGDLFNLPGGAVRFAVGGVHLGNTFSDAPDSLTKAGQTTGSTNFQPTRGSRDSWSAFWEASVPVTGPTWNFPGAYSLEFGYAERYENYSDFGSTERPKFDVRWQPIDQSLTLRAAYIEAFHAPSLGELFGGTAQTFPIIIDPFTVRSEERRVG